MKRAMLIGAVAALCVAGSAVAEESTGLIGSGTRAGDNGQVVGSGNAAGQTLGSGGFTASSQDSQILGSGARSADGSQTTADAGGLIGSGTRAEDSGQVIGSGNAVPTANGGSFGSGLAARLLRLFDGSSLLVVSSDQGTFVIPLAE